MKLIYKLIIEIVVVILLIVAVGFFGFRASKQIAWFYSGISDEFKEDVNAAVESSSYIKRAEGHLLLYLTLGGEEDGGKFYARHKSLEEQIEILERVVTTSGGVTSLNKLKSASKDILRLGSQLKEAYERNPETFKIKDHAEAIKLFHDAASTGREAGVEIAKFELSVIRGNVEEAKKTAADIQNKIIIISAIAILILIVLGIIKYRYINIPFMQLKNSMKKIATGDTNIDIDIKSQDEIGQLQWEFQQMAEVLKNTTVRRDELVKEITRRKQLEEELKAISLTDDLTGLYNRRGFFTLTEHLLKVAKREKRGMFMLYADLDGLKGINDNFGHKEGDNALIDFADILKTSYRESDVIARIGGDEFVVIPVGFAGDNEEIINNRLQEKLDAHNAKGNRRYSRLSVSAGIAFYDPEKPCSIDELLNQGDKLMYESKKNKS